MTKNVKLRFLSLIVVMFTMCLPSFAGGSRYYSRLTATAVGEGKVYASERSSNNPSYAENSSTATQNGQSNSAPTHTYYVYAQAKDGNVFVGWYDNAECTGSALSTNESYQYAFSVTSTSQNNPTSKTIYAKFVRTDAPTNLKVTKIGPSDATVSWSGSADSYNLRYRLEGASTTYNFDAGFGTWTNIDADGDGFKWALNSIDQTYRSYKADENLELGLGHGGSADMVISGSFCSNSNDPTYHGQALTPDNYLVSPQVTLGGTIRFWAKGMDPADCAEKFGVAVSTSGNTSASSFTMVGEQKTATAEWTLYTFDLSEYDGQTGYVAIRHYDCTDQDMLCVDDVVITAPGAGAWTEVNGISETSKKLESLTQTTGYQVCIQAVYEGIVSNWVGTRFSTTGENPVPAEVVVDPIGQTDATISWFGLSDSYEVKYRADSKDGPQYFFEDFEGGLTEKGWTVYTEGETGSNTQGWHEFDPSQSSYKFTAYSGIATVRALSWINVQVGDISADNWLVTPQVTIGKMLKFWVRANPGYPDEYEVLLSTGGNAIADFTITLQALTEAPAVNGWTRIEIPIDDEYVDRDGYIAIHHLMEGGNYLLIDDFGLFGPDVEGAEGWTTVPTTDLTVELEDLVPNTKYEYTITGIKGDSSATTEVAFFTTLPMDELELVDNADNTLKIQSLHGLVDVDVKLVGRTLKADTWNTLCLPCNVKLTDGKLDGVNVDVRKLAGAELDGTTMNLTFESVTEIVAGTPYIIKPESAITNPVFEKALVRKGENPSTFTLDGDDIKVSFKGTYKPLTFTATDKSILFLRNGSFYYPVNNSYINSQRAYLQLTGIHAGKPAPAPTKEFTFKDNLDDDPTAIAELLGLTEDNGAWYDLNGRKLAGKPSQKGIYINNGKKTIIK